MTSDVLTFISDLLSLLIHPSPKFLGQFVCSFAVESMSLWSVANWPQLVTVKYTRLTHTLLSTLVSGE